MDFKIDKFHSDILIKMSNEEISHVQLTKRLGICKPAIWRLGEGAIPKIAIFCKLLKWLDKDANEYIN